MVGGQWEREAVSPGNVVFSCSLTAISATLAPQFSLGRVQNGLLYTQMFGQGFDSQ